MKNLKEIYLILSTLVFLMQISPAQNTSEFIGIYEGNCICKSHTEPEFIDTLCISLNVFSNVSDTSNMQFMIEGEITFDTIYTKLIENNFEIFQQQTDTSDWAIYLRGKGDFGTNSINFYIDYGGRIGQFNCTGQGKKKSTDIISMYYSLNDANILYFYNPTEDYALISCLNIASREKATLTIINQAGEIVKSVNLIENFPLRIKYSRFKTRYLSLLFNKEQ